VGDIIFQYLEKVKRIIPGIGKQVSIICHNNMVKVKIFLPYN
jgi:hypothetical protein